MAVTSSSLTTSSSINRTMVRFLIITIAFFALLPMTTTTTTMAFSPVSLKTTATALPTSASELHRFLGTTSNWPKIVASSHSVVQTTTNIDDLDKPLPVGKSVDEIFGLPPLLPLQVTWKCVASVIAPITTSSSKSKKRRQGKLEYYSQEGLAGVAKECSMTFTIVDEDDNQGDDSSCCNVVLEMCYTPESPLAVLATPVLVADNALALKVLLPAAIAAAAQQEAETSTSTSTDSLQEFRNLMGTLYGVAGLAHAVDCLAGPSTLLTTAGAPAYWDLPIAGQLYALAWCAAGPLAFVASRAGPKAADLGLIVYGLVEVGGAVLIGANTSTAAAVAVEGTTGTAVVANAIVVQAVVALAWLYSSSRNSNNNNKD